MKWAEEQIAELKDLCFAEKPNSEIAERLGVSVSEIYAKRSQLGITIVLLEKKQLVKSLENVIMFADKSVTGLELSEDGNAVLIKYGQWSKKVDVECDSHLAIIFDVTKKCLY